MIDMFVYSPAALTAQAEQRPLELGYHRLQFYVDGYGILAKENTGVLGDFFYSPSGGTLRDANLNIVLYSAKFDKYKAIGKQATE